MLHLRHIWHRSLDNSAGVPSAAIGFQCCAVCKGEFSGGGSGELFHCGFCVVVFHGACAKRLCPFMTPFQEAFAFPQCFLQAAAMCEMAMDAWPGPRAIHVDRACCRVAHMNTRSLWCVVYTCCVRIASTRVVSELHLLCSTLRFPCAPMVVRVPGS
eukprot:436198-Lingulodinium_polyedra.AAC.1